MALFAFDGTWNQERSDDTQYKNTNVSRFHAAYRRHSGTDDFYRAGVGTRFGVVGKVLGGAFGLGELPRLNEAYDHLCATWANGDRVIDIVGFSRGAATTLDFCHIIQERGIRAPGTDRVVDANPQIRFLGVWDVVAAFGIANLGLSDLNIGHHLSLPKANLKYAFHALALDERRPSFLPTRLRGACEVWFRGVHSDVGGGNTNRGLNDIALTWMLSKAKAVGLPIASDDIQSLKPDPRATPRFDRKLPLEVRLISAVDWRHYTVSHADGCTSPPDTCAVETPEAEQSAAELGANGLETLPAELRLRIAVLYQAAQVTAEQLEFPIEGARESLLSLIEGRIPLVTDDQKLESARRAVVSLVSEMVRGAQRRGFHALNEFFLTEALWKLRPLFPFTD